MYKKRVVDLVDYPFPATTVIMEKYILMIGGIIVASIVGGVGVMYSLITSAPFSITRQDTLPATETEDDAQLAEGVPTMTITIR